jgi:hypothetical protein
MAIDFPNSPTTGDIHTVSGKQWQWDSEKWIAYGSSLAPDVLKVDSGNNRVGINQTSPAYSLDVTGTARITGDLTVQGTTTTIESAAVNTSLIFEGATADSYETTLTLVDPTADRTITLPNNTGTVALTTDNVASATLAATATALATARTIGGTSFDGTAAIVPGTITVADTTDTTCSVALFESATGDLAPKTDGGATYNAGTGTLTATAFAGPLTGNVTGNASGTAATVTGAAQANITSVGTLTGLTIEGTVDMVDGTGAGRHEELQGPKIKDYAETVNAIGAIGGGTQDIDLKLGNVVTGTVDTSTTTFTFTGEPTSGIGISFTLILANGGSQTVNWPSEVKWAGGTAPTLTTSGTDVLTFTTVDAGGTSWYGFAAGLAMA